MKVFIAGLDTETNTFSPIPTGYQSFVDGFLARGDATRPEACPVVPANQLVDSGLGAGLAG